MLNSVIKPQLSITAQPKAQRVQQGKLQAGTLVQRKPQPARLIMASANQKDDADQFVAPEDSVKDKSKHTKLDQETYKKICARWEASGVPLQHLSKEDYKKICAQFDVDPTFDFNIPAEEYHRYDRQTFERLNHAERQIRWAAIHARGLKRLERWDYKVMNAARSAARELDRREALKSMAQSSFGFLAMNFLNLRLGSAISYANCNEKVTSASKGPLDTEKAFNQFFKTLSEFTGPLTEPQKKEIREVVIKAKKEGKPICLPVPCQFVLPVKEAAEAGIYNLAVLTLFGLIDPIPPLGLLMVFTSQCTGGILALGIGWAVADVNKQLIFIPKNSKPEDVSKLVR